MSFTRRRAAGIRAPGGDELDWLEATTSRLLVSPERIEAIDWSERRVRLGLTRERIKAHAEYEPLTDSGDERDERVRRIEHALHSEIERPLTLMRFLQARSHPGVSTRRSTALVRRLNPAY